MIKDGGRRSADETFGHSSTRQATAPSEVLGRSPPLAPDSHTLSQGYEPEREARGLRMWAGQTRPDAHREASFTYLTAHSIQRRDGNQAAYGFRRRSTRSPRGFRQLRRAVS